MQQKVKVLILGNSFIGKTAMMIRFTEDTFSTSHGPTLGVDFKMKNTKIKVQQNKQLVNTQIQLWDTAGQEQFQTLTPNYYRSADAIILAFSLADRESFEQVGFWYGTIAQHVDIKSLKLVLVGNKADLKDKIVVSDEEVNEWNQEHQLKYFRTSAKTGQNIDEIFFELARQVIDQKVENGDIQLEQVQDVRNDKAEDQNQKSLPQKLGSLDQKKKNSSCC